MPETIAKEAVSKLFARTTRRQRTEANRPVEAQFKNLHAAGWGVPKVGKTHIGLGATSHEVRLPGAIPEGAGPFAKPEPGEIVIPSKPLLVAHANFDRPADTVEDNLPSGYQYVEERFFEDEDGNQIWVPDDAQIERLIIRLNSFIRDASGECDMFVLDGATIIWDDVRHVRLGEPAGKDPDGGVKHLPRQYGVANAEMRASVMQAIYSADFNSWLTMEAGEKWSGQNKPDVDAFGNAILRMDGWNRSGHYCDTIGQVKFVELADGNGGMKWTRQYIPGPGSIRATMIGQVITDPTFREIYKRAFPNVPLLKREDRELYAKLVAEHGPLMW